MTHEYFSSVVDPVISSKFRASSWALDASRRKFSTRWYIALLDKYSNHKDTFEEVDKAVSEAYRLGGIHGKFGYYKALTNTKYYKYRQIFTKVQR